MTLTYEEILDTKIFTTYRRKVYDITGCGNFLCGNCPFCHRRGNFISVCLISGKQLSDDMTNPFRFDWCNKNEYIER